MCRRLHARVDAFTVGSAVFAGGLAPNAGTLANQIKAVHTGLQPDQTGAIP